MYMVLQYPLPHRLPLRGERLLLPLRGVALPPAERFVLSESPTKEAKAAERQTMGLVHSE